MQTDLNIQFEAIKKIDWTEGIVSFWLIKRKLVNREAQYEILKVEIESHLKIRLKEIMINNIKDKNEIEEYNFASQEQDDVVFALNIDGTDFVQIRGRINQGSEVPKVGKVDELYGAWAYVIKIQIANQSIYGCRKIGSSWNVKKVKNGLNLIFENEVLVDLDNKQVFRIESKIDFIEFNNLIYILDKKEFENILNFRDRMERIREQVTQEFQELSILKNIPIFKTKIGNNLRLLRKIAMVDKNGYFRNKEFMERLSKLNSDEKWGLEIDQNQIIVTEKNVELILTLLNNNRLRSPITEETFDVPSKKKVG